MKHCFDEDNVIMEMEMELRQLAIRLSHQSDIKVNSYSDFKIVLYMKRVCGFAGRISFTSDLSEDLKYQITEEAYGEDILLSTITGASCSGRSFN